MSIAAGEAAPWQPPSNASCRGAFAFEAEADDADLVRLAEAAGAAIDDALDFIAASNQRIAAMEAAARPAAPRVRARARKAA
jgi:hypothetical protein